MRRCSRNDAEKATPAGPPGPGGSATRLNAPACGASRAAAPSPRPRPEEPASCKLSRRMRTVGLTALVVALGVAVAAARQRVDYAFTVVAPRSVSRSQLVARVVIVAPRARCPGVVAPAAEREEAPRIPVRPIAA